MKKNRDSLIRFSKILSVGLLFIVVLILSAGPFVGIGIREPVPATEISLRRVRGERERLISAYQQRMSDEFMVRYKQKTVNLKSNPVASLEEMRPVEPNETMLKTISLKDEFTPEQKRYLNSAEQAAERGEVLVILPWGGMATRAASALQKAGVQSKATLPLAKIMPDGKIAFDENTVFNKNIPGRVIAFGELNILRAKALGRKVKLLVNASSYNYSEIMEFLKENNYFGLKLNEDLFIGQPQGKWASLNPFEDDIKASGKRGTILGTPGEPFVFPAGANQGQIRTNPPGHLDMTTDSLFLNSSLVRQMAEGKVKYALFANVDNAGVTYDELRDKIQLGMFIDSNSSAFAEVSPRLGINAEGKFGVYEVTPEGKLIFRDLSTQLVKDNIDTTKLADKGGRFTITKGIFGVTEDFALALGYNDKYKTMEADPFFNPNTLGFRLDALTQLVINSSLSELGNLSISDLIARLENFKKNGSPMYVEIKDIDVEGVTGKVLVAQGTQLVHSSLVPFAGLKNWASPFGFSVGRERFAPVKEGADKDLWWSVHLVNLEALIRRLIGP
jgi:hypothetical protein